MSLPVHKLKVVLVEPEIPQNTGNIARLCAATGAQLHLVRPLGFFLSDKHFKRAGMDYLKQVDLVVHDDLNALMADIGNEPAAGLWFTSGLYGSPHWSVPYQPGDWVFFGKESAGLPGSLLEAHRDRVVQIPMVEKTRGLNISTAAGIVVYEALRRFASSPGPA